MELRSIFFWATIGLLLPLAIYGFHRVCLYLEDQGLLYYIRSKSSTGAASSMMGLQRELEPQTRYVQQIAEERRYSCDDEAPGDGEFRTAQEQSEQQQ